jgi:hypothetical protein
LKIPLAEQTMTVKLVSLLFAPAGEPKEKSKPFDLDFWLPLLG